MKNVGETMNEITRERLECIASWRAKYSAGHNVVLPAEEAEYLARIALASLEAEAVVWTDEMARMLLASMGSAQEVKQEQKK